MKEEKNNKNNKLIWIRIYPDEEEEMNKIVKSLRELTGEKTNSKAVKKYLKWMVKE